MIFPADDLVADSPKATPLFSAAASVCDANIWTSINGWSVARVFTSVAQEYEAAKSGAVIADLGALARYAVRGPAAASFLARLTTAPAVRLEPGESARGLILNSEGAVIDLAEVSRLSDELFLLTSPRPHARRLRLGARGLDVEIDDISGQVAALGIFGPAARDAAASVGVEVGNDSGAASGRVRGVETAARSTQFGSLPGVEMIFPKEEALTIWERLMRMGEVTPAGLDALDIIRLEGGAPRPGADFVSAENGGNTRTPAELGLAHLAPLNRGWFNGRRSLRRLAQTPARMLISLTLDTEHPMPGAAVFAADKPVGRITSCAFSPSIKRVIAFADIARTAIGKPMEVAVPPPAEGRVAAKFQENPEKALEDDFLNSQRTAANSRRFLG